MWAPRTGRLGKVEYFSWNSWRMSVGHVIQIRSLWEKSVLLVLIILFEPPLHRCNAQLRAMKHIVCFLWFWKQKRTKCFSDHDLQLLEVLCFFFYYKHRRALQMSCYSITQTFFEGLNLLSIFSGYWSQQRDSKHTGGWNNKGSAGSSQQVT